MFRRVHQFNTLMHFLRERLPHYGPLLKQDLHAFRDEMVRAALGAIIAAVAGLLFACFVSIAVIVSARDTPYRILSAWIVCAGWVGVTLAGLIYARHVVFSGPAPFRLAGSALERDYAHLLFAIEKEGE